MIVELAKPHVHRKIFRRTVGNSDNKTKSDIKYNPKTRVSIRSMDAMQKSWGMFEINCEKSHPLPFSSCVGEPRA